MNLRLIHLSHHLPCTCALHLIPKKGYLLVLLLATQKPAVSSENTVGPLGSLVALAQYTVGPCAVCLQSTVMGKPGPKALHPSLTFWSCLYLAQATKASSTSHHSEQTRQ